ncbi:DUF6502 family protein [Sphaerotilus natans]|uniref:DUF6502 family protein n=1 Tax=Sphaerotilus natans TaxID=34103 RepID=UPI00406C8C27
MSLSSSDPDSVDDPAAEVLADAAVMLAPMVRWLLGHGVPLGALTRTLKQVYLDEGRSELARRGQRVTDSALSVLTGVHRKDVRQMQTEQPGRPALAPTPAAMLFTRWITDLSCRDAEGRPRASLPRQGPAPSFESLAREVCSDVHPRTLLEELLRLGLVRVEGEEVLRLSERFVLPGRDPAAAQAMAVNVADHLAAAVHNLGCDLPGRRLLEQSVFAEGLSPQAAAELGVLARAIWAEALERMVREAEQRLERDCDRDAEGAAPVARMRFGVYYFTDMEDADDDDDAGRARPRR